MAVDYQQVYRDLHDFIVEATGLDTSAVRPAYQNAPTSPSQDRGTLVTINLINQTELGIDSRQYANDGTDLAESVYGDRNITASINVYADDDSHAQEAQNVIENIVLYLRSSAGSEFLNGKELGYLRHGSVLNLSALQNGNWENRRQVDIEFHIIVSVENAVNAIETASVNWQYEGSGTITGTIEVSE